MSLINDALKKVSRNNWYSSNTSKPVTFIHPGGNFGRRRNPIRILVVCGLCLSVLALILLGIWFKNSMSGGKKQQYVQAKTNSLLEINNDFQKQTFETDGTTIVAVHDSENSNTSVASISPSLNEQTSNNVIFPPHNIDEQKTNNISSVEVTIHSMGNIPIHKNENADKIIAIAKRADDKSTAKTEQSPKSNSIKILPVKFPELKINGIFYQKTKPSAIINGKILFVGEGIEGAKVIAIESETVTIEYQGEKRVLKM